MVTKTKLEILRLKDEWCYDPIWDIEDTEGFEDHYAELKAYRYDMEAKWKQERIDRINEQAKKRNCSFELAKYTLELERQIKQIKEKIWE